MRLNLKRALIILCIFLLSLNCETYAQDKTSDMGHITVMVFDRGLVPNSEGDAANNRWTHWINENAPVNVEFVPVARADADSILINMFAAGDAPDIIPYGANPQTFVNNGMCLEITDEMLKKTPNYLRRISSYPEIDKATKLNGMRYSFGRTENVFHNHSIVIRKDWLDRLGLSVPETVNELLEVIRAFTYDDPDGNGIQDTWGTSMTTNTQRIYAHMWGFPWPEKYVFNDDGRVTYVWDRMESWLGFIKTIVEEECVNPDFMIMKDDDDCDDFLKGRIGIYGQGRFSQAFAGLSLYRDFKEMNPEGELATFALPATEYGKYTAYINGGVSVNLFINPGTRNLDGALAYINWLMEPDVEEYLSFGPVGVYYDKAEDGAYYAKASAQTIEDELIWSPFFDASIDLNGDEGIDRFANDQYNQYLRSNDTTTQEFGALFYQMACIANEPGAVDPRKWQQFLPILPKNLNLIKVKGNTAIDNILTSAMVDPDITASEAVARARKLWIEAGGEQVDSYYDYYYANAGDRVLRMSDFEAMKAMPQLTETAMEAYERIVTGD